MEGICVERLDYLSLVAAVMNDLGLVSLLDTRLKPDNHEAISLGEAVKGMMFNGLGFANRPCRCACSSLPICPSPCSFALPSPPRCATVSHAVAPCPLGCHTGQYPPSRRQRDPVWTNSAGRSKVRTCNIMDIPVIHASRDNGQRRDLWPNYLASNWRPCVISSPALLPMLLKHLMSYPVMKGLCCQW